MRTRISFRCGSVQRLGLVFLYCNLMSSPLEMIDDTDSSIQYDSGPWFEAQVNHGYLVNTGTTNDFGPPYHNTSESHGVKLFISFQRYVSTVDLTVADLFLSPLTLLLFPLAGSAVFVFGSIILTNASENENPFLHWDCLSTIPASLDLANPFLPPSLIKYFVTVESILMEKPCFKMVPICSP